MCVRERERERVCVSLCACVCMGERESVCASVCNIHIYICTQDNQGLTERVTTVATVENQLQDALLQNSVLQTHLRYDQSFPE